MADIQEQRDLTENAVQAVIDQIDQGKGADQQQYGAPRPCERRLVAVDEREARDRCTDNGHDVGNVDAAHPPDKKSEGCKQGQSYDEDRLHKNL